VASKPHDYNQPEAYVPHTDTYIERESDINEQIDRVRHAATRAVLERDDVIIVASVPSIYLLGVRCGRGAGADWRDVQRGRRKSPLLALGGQHDGDGPRAPGGPQSSSSAPIDRRIAFNAVDDRMVEPIVDGVHPTGVHATG
jgi:hypothetical protein